MTAAIEYLNGFRLSKGLVAGIARLVESREAINRINVYPVPDGDTGTNMAYTAREIARRLDRSSSRSAGAVLAAVADAAIDGARGNSGAILASFFQGMSESVGERVRLTLADFAAAGARGSSAAQGALADPKRGTILSVMKAWATQLQRSATSGVSDIRQALGDALAAARTALSETTEQLQELRDAGVVDAGALGFVDWLEGVDEYIRRGSVRATAPDLDLPEDEVPGIDADFAHDDRFRFCTECVITGEGVDRIALREALIGLGGASLAIAGSKRKARVHMHVDNPAALFLVCEQFGAVSSRKADDMHQQTASRITRDRVAVMTDSAADLPEEEEERLGIHIVPLRIDLGGRQHLDGVSLTPEEFYAALRTEEEGAKTSQPPPGDFRRQFEFLMSHHPAVVSVNASSVLSGTFQSALKTAERVGEDVHVVDARNVAAGEGLLAIYAAEAAAAGCTAEQIVTMLESLRSQTITWGVVSDLSYGVKGGRIPGWVKRIGDVFNMCPILGSTRAGNVKPRGAVWGKRNVPRKFAKFLTKRLSADVTWRLMIAHGDWPEGGRELHDLLIGALPHVHSSYITAAGTAFGVHAGPGSLVVGAQPYEVPVP